MNDKPLNLKQLTPKEYHQLLSNAIQQYKDAVWSLADILKIGRDKFDVNRKVKNLACYTFNQNKIPKNKYMWLLAIASLTNRNPNLLPEHHAEVVNLSQPTKWLKRAEKENLDPAQLRRAIRSKQKQVKKEAKLSVPSWSKNFLIIEKELADMPTSQSQKIIDHLKNRLNDKVQSS